MRGPSTPENQATPEEIDLVRRVLEALRSQDSNQRQDVLDELVRYIEPAVTKAANRVLMRRPRRGELKEASRELLGITFLGLIQQNGRSLSTWDAKKGGLSAWIWRVATRRAQDWVARGPELAPIEVAASDSDHGEYMELVEKKEFLDKLFEKMPGNFSPAEAKLAHMILRLKWSAEKIAEELGIKSNSVHQRVFRIRRKLLGLAQRLRGEG